MSDWRTNLPSKVGTPKNDVCSMLLIVHPSQGAGSSWICFAEQVTPYRVSHLAPSLPHSLDFELWLRFARKVGSCPASELYET